MVTLNTNPGNGTSLDPAGKNRDDIVLQWYNPAQNLGSTPPWNSHPVAIWFMNGNPNACDTCQIGYGTVLSQANANPDWRIGAVGDFNNPNTGPKICGTGS